MWEGRKAKGDGFEQWYHIREINTLMSIGKTIGLDKVPGWFQGNLWEIGVILQIENNEIQ